MFKKELLKQATHLIDNWLDYQTYITETPGLAVGIFMEDEIVFQKEYGYANLEKKTKLTSDHLFRIASHSKLFTASAILKLYHKDKLSLDDRVSKHLEWFRSEKDPKLDRIRIRHLLSHSSGITRDGEIGHWQSFDFPDLDGIIDLVQGGISYYETNETLKYSNIGYTILGQVVEAVSGKSYEEYIQQEILDPLGMKNTVVDVTPENESRHATGYHYRLPRQERKPFPHVPANVMHSATGLSSNVSDLIKFFQSHMMGNESLFPDYIKREMQTVKIQSPPQDWGLGFALVGDKKDRKIGHGGGYPGFITFSALDQKKKLIIVTLTNAVDGVPFNFMQGMVNLLSKLGESKDKLLKEDQDDFSEIIGFYAGHWRPILYSQVGSKLVSIYPVLIDPSPTLQIYDQNEDLSFTQPLTLPTANPGEKVTFHKDDNGIYHQTLAGITIARYQFEY